MAIMASAATPMAMPTAMPVVRASCEQPGPHSSCSAVLLRLGSAVLDVAPGREDDGLGVDGPLVPGRPVPTPAGGLPCTGCAGVAERMTDAGCHCWVALR